MAVIDINWIFGVGIMFMLALGMTYITYKDVETFFIFLTIFSGFVVWAGLLPLWVLVMCLIVLTLIMINNIKKGRGGL